MGRGRPRRPESGRRNSSPLPAGQAVHSGACRFGALAAGDPEPFIEAGAIRLEEVEKAGVTIYRPEKAPYQEKVKDVYESYKDQKTIYSYIKRSWWLGIARQHLII